MWHKLRGGLQPVLGWKCGTGSRAHGPLLAGRVVELMRAEIGLPELLRSRQLVISPRKVWIEERGSKTGLAFVVFVQILVELG